MLRKKVPLYLLLIVSLLSCTFVFFITKSVDSKKSDSELKDGFGNADQNPYKITRLTGFNFIRPLLAAKPLYESPKYSALKDEVSQIIQNFKDQGILMSSSIYLRDFDKSDWFCVNEDEKYMPGSLLKVPELITYLKMEETKSGTLNKRITFSNNFSTTKQANIITKSIVLGQTYTIRELLNYMIEYSDNNATYLLNQNIDVPTFKKTFTDLGLESPDWNAQTYYISTKSYSVFMEALFNASYLNIKDSEYATALLTKTDFIDGMIKGIQNNHLRIAHKFGEAGTNQNKELHESALLYVNDSPYLLTIMTKGNNNVDFPKLSGVIQAISNVVYNKLSEVNTNSSNNNYSSK